MNTLVLLLSFVTFLSTLVGGLFIFRFKKYLPYFFAFAAGSLMAVSFFDLLPESLSIANASNVPMRSIMIAIVASFFFYSLLEKFFLTHQHEEKEGHEHIMGPVGAGGLVLHSFLDGIAIGSAFQASYSVGIVVAFAVIFHDFTDGINTVTIMFKNNQKSKLALIFLLMDALAPVLGILLTSIFVLPESILAIVLAIFVGEFIYIGAVSLLPETHKHKSRWTVLFVALGILLIMFLTSLL